MAYISLDTGMIVGMALEAAIWGFSFLLFGMTMFMLCRGRSPSEISKRSVVTALILLSLSTTHVVWNVKRIVTAYILEEKSEGTDGIPPLATLKTHAIVTYVTYCLQTMVGDAVLISRCYTVWQSYLVVLGPIVLWCGMAVTLGGTLCQLVQGPQNTHLMFTAKAASHWATSFYSLTLATNLIATALLAYRIWSVERNSSLIKARVTRNTLFPIMMVIIDAGVLYSALLVAVIAAHSASSNAVVIIIDMIVPIISCIFYVILIRIAISQSKHKSLVLSVPTGPFQPRTSEFIRRENVVPLEVHITRSITASAKDLNEDHDEIFTRPSAQRDDLQ